MHARIISKAEKKSYLCSDDLSKISHVMSVGSDYVISVYLNPVCVCVCVCVSCMCMYVCVSGRIICLVPSISLL